MFRSKFSTFSLTDSIPNPYKYVKFYYWVNKVSIFKTMFYPAMSMRFKLEEKPRSLRVKVVLLPGSDLLLYHLIMVIRSPRQHCIRLIYHVCLIGCFIPFVTELYIHLRRVGCDGDHIYDMRRKDSYSYTSWGSFTPRSKRYIV